MIENTWVAVDRLRIANRGGRPSPAGFGIGRRLRALRHGLDFAGCEANFDHFTITREDLREAYGEKRLVTFGLLGGEVVVLVHTERPIGIHVISLREAEKHEARYYFEVAKDYFK